MLVRSGLRRLLALPVVALLALTPAGAYGTSAGDALYLQAPRLVDAGGFRLAFRCAGHGRPVVVFDAGLGDWSAAWSTVQPTIARTTRTCSYDRAGNGASEAGPFPRTSGRIVNELQTALRNAGERPPYVLVGHSFGSFTMRLFADRHPAETAGIVLVDGSHEDQSAVLGSVGLSDFEHQLADCGRAAARGFPLRTMRAACVGLFFRGLPERRFSARLNASLERAALAPKQYAATLSEAQNFDTVSAAEVRAAKRSYGSISLRILVATNHRSPGAKGDAAYWRRWEAAWRRLHNSWLPLSTNAVEITASGSGHYIQLDRPALVIGTITAVVNAARSRRPSP